MSSFYVEIKNIFTNPYYGRKYGKMSLALLLIAITYNLFICSINLVAGGSGGVGVLFNYLFGTDPSLVVFIISFLMFVLAFIFLDADQVVSTFFVALVYPLMVKVTSGLGDIFLIDTTHVLIIVLFGAILTGFGQGVIFRLGLNFGSFSIVAKIFYKYFKISVTLVNALINASVVLIGGFFLGIDMVLYAIVFIVVSRYVSEKVILGISTNKTFKIISNQYLKIEKFIEESLKHDVTIYDTYGAFNGKDKKLLMTVIPSSEFVILKDFVKSVDKNAFVFVTDTYEAKGQDVLISKEKC